VALDSAIAASGRLVAWPMAEGFVTVWEEGSAAVESLTHPRSITAMYSAAINPAESIVAAGNGRGFIFLWDLATGEPIGEPIAAGDERLVSLAFSPDGEMLASGDAVGVTRLWDVATGVAVGNPLIRSRDVLLDVTFSPDGTLLATSGFGDITAWRIGLGESLSSGCAVAARSLTQAEWTQYIGDGFSYTVTCPEYGPPSE
jgi:WD40 repeat protein